MKTAVVILLVASLSHQLPLLAAGKSASFPTEFASCNNGDDVCLMGAITSALKLLKNGMSSVGILPLDPLRITEMSLDNRGHGGAVYGILVLKEVDLVGLSDTVVTSVKSEFGDKSYRIEIHGNVPTISFIGNYTVNGQVLVLPVRGAGKENITNTNLDCTYILTGHVVDKGGVEYVKIDDFKFTFTSSHMYMYFANLFGGDERLGNRINEVLNENWQDVFNEFRPLSEEALGAVYKEIASRFYDRIPYRMIHSNSK